MNKFIKRRLFNTLKFAFSGIKAAFASEEAFRVETALFIILMPIGFFIGKTDIEKTLLIGVLFIVLIVELLNSTIETAIDKFGTDYNELSKKAKDMSSAAVFISILLVMFVWGMIIW